MFEISHMLHKLRDAFIPRSARVHHYDRGDPTRPQTHAARKLQGAMHDEYIARLQNVRARDVLITITNEVVERAATACQKCRNEGSQEHDAAS